MSSRVNVGPGNFDMNNVFMYHPPTPDQVERYQEVRKWGRIMAETIVETCPASAERSTALAKVREAVMWANAAIACNEPDALQSVPHPAMEGE